MIAKDGCCGLEKFSKLSPLCSGCDRYAGSATRDYVMRRSSSTFCGRQLLVSRSDTEASSLLLIPSLPVSFPLLSRSAPASRMGRRRPAVSA
jgi:hypothetical protein